MVLELTHPYYLLGLLLLAVLLWAYRRSLVDFSRVQRRASLFVRSLILTLLVLALAGLTLLLPTHEKTVVFLVDESRSIDAGAREIAEQYLKRAEAAAGTTPIAILPFAGTVRKRELGSKIESRDEDEAIGEQTKGKNDDAATDIARAIEPAIAMLPPDRVPLLVLLSDGNETVGDALAAVIQGGVPVATVPLPAAETPEVQLAELNIPPQVRQGEPFTIEVVVQSNRESEGKIAVFREGFKIVEENRSLEIGKNVFRFQQSVTDRRQLEYSATVESPDDTIIDNNTASGLIFVGGKPRMLLIESEPNTVRDFAAALRQQEIETEIRPTEGMPRTLEEFENFEAVILSNVPATSFSIRQMDLLRTYVRDLGGGLLMLGGEQSFGLGGYSKTPLEEVLPVSCNPEKEKEKPSLAMCLVIDRSGSMGGEKMEMAKDAAKSAVELLTPRDFVAVVAFDGATYLITPIQNVSSPSSVNSAISTIEAAGGTSIYPALVDALDQLNRVSAKLKHVILLTDGYSEPGDFEGIVRQMVDARITVSTVGVGQADNELLQGIATNGGGRHYSCDDPQAIPQIFARETMIAAKSSIHEEPFVPVTITPTEVLAGVPLETAPPLLGFVVTKAKPTSQFILATESGEPLLVWWRYGLGMSTAFTSDAKNRWAADWTVWEGFASFWAQVVRHTMRTSQTRGTMIELERRGSQVGIVLDAVDDLDRYINKGEGTLTVIGPDLSREELTLEPSAPGRYEASFPAAHRGGYHAQIALRSGETTVASQSRGVMVGSPEELRLKPTNTALLQQIADSSGGRYDPTPESLFEPEENRIAWKIVPLWPYLLTAALGLFVFDVLLRRIDLARRRRSDAH